jgi:type II restriction enzyme
MSEEDYLGYVLSTEDEIDEFLSAFCMGPADTGAMINIKPIMAEAALEEAFVRYIAGLDSDFPSTSAMSFAARTIENDIYNHEADAFQDPDKKLVSWVKMEYQLFKRVEQERYLGIISKGFNTVDAFVETANSILNKRKSRAGKSLENHLAAIFDYNALRYSAQPVTEGKKRPDFIFPSEAAYHTPGYSAEKLVFLGAKTTCKDRWRQVINEANRIHDKHLITLQQGISTQQLDEMEAAGVILVVPRPYIGAYPRERQAKIWTLRKFIEFAKEKTTLC